MYNSTIKSMKQINLPGSGAILAQYFLYFKQRIQSTFQLHGIGKELSDDCLSSHGPEASDHFDSHSEGLDCLPEECHPELVSIKWGSESTRLFRVAEFKKWTAENDRMMEILPVYELDSSKTYDARLQKLKTWYKGKQPAVMIIGYEM